MTIRSFKPLACIVLALLVFAVAAVPAAADVIVLAVRGGAAVKAGDTLADTATIDLPAGASADVLLPSGAIRTLSGPGKTAVQALTKGEKADAGLFDKVSGIVAKTGSESNVGAVRSVAPSRPRPSVRFSWTEIPVDADGDWCVDKSANLALARPGGDRPLTLTVVDVAASQRADVAFKPGDSKAPWPDALPPKVGTYGLLLPERPMRQIRLRLIAPLPDRDDTLRVLFSQRCEAQMQAFLAEALRGAR